MFISTSQIKIFLYRHTIDGRWGMDRLFALVDSELHLDPRSGTLFVFFNRNRSLARDLSMGKDGLSEGRLRMSMELLTGWFDQRLLLPQQSRGKGQELRGLAESLGDSGAKVREDDAVISELGLQLFCRFPSPFS
jgi:hypothetical protein